MRLQEWEQDLLSAVEETRECAPELPYEWMLRGNDPDGFLDWLSVAGTQR